MVKILNCGAPIPEAETKLDKNRINITNVNTKHLFLFMFLLKEQNVYVYKHNYKKYISQTGIIKNKQENYFLSHRRIIFWSEYSLNKKNLRVMF